MDLLAGFLLGVLHGKADAHQGKGCQNEHHGGGELAVGDRAAQLGGTITDGEFTTAMVLILAALALMRISFAVKDAEEKAGKKVHKEPQNTVKGRKKVG